MESLCEIDERKMVKCEALAYDVMSIQQNVATISNVSSEFIAQDFIRSQVKW